MSGYEGRTVGDFCVRERLGSGGVGEVYLADQLTLGRQAVIKFLARPTNISSEAAARFLREARLASRLDHPFAAHVYAFGIEPDGTLWIAMELVRGTPLDKLVATQGPLPLARFVPFFERLCEVLSAAHDQDIIHRDIKPANVMVIQRAGKMLPKLLDLGIARAGAPVPSAPDPVDLTELLDANTEGDALSESMVGRLTRSESMQLTQVGSLVGTPYYMAPEQWLDASQVGARADIYSLAILAYQCLTGALPFQSKNLRGMARAHATSPLPALPDSLPSGLYEVLAKGAAKKPDERFETPLSFAVALRAASGIGTDPPALPHFETGLYDNLINEAPQPLAEAVALFDSARGPRQATASLATVVKIICRTLAMYALAGRVRVGPGGQESEVTKRLLQQLHEKGLADTDWLDLTRALVLPFSTKPDAHPLPELVRYVASEGFAVLQAVAQGAPDATANDEQLIQQLHATVGRLTAALRPLQFLFEYAVVVPSESGPERWMGSRRVVRPTQRVVEPAEPGSVLLVDSVGSVVLTLSPLVQCASPSVGRPEELFMLEGPGRRGARSIAWPSSFETQDEALWGWLSQHGLLTHSLQSSAQTERPPYKGLSTFGVADADNYFGREKEAQAFANRLRDESFLAVVGPSGTGKSSFVLAGVLPLLSSGWRPLVVRPGANPFAALHARLESAGLPDLTKGLDPLLEALQGGSLLLVVDQFEELVTLCADAQLRNRFAEQVLAAARHPSGRVRVVVTLRDDFLIKVQQLPAFRDVLSSALQLLGTPGPDDLVRVVSEPARRVGYSFDDPSLPRRMVDAVSEYPGALALLSFTASQLWELRDRQLRLMRAKTYEVLGGVGGALANHAETTMASLSADEQRLVREAFRHLVTGQGTRTVLSKQEALEVLGGTSAAQSVINRLIDARLLVSSETADGHDSVEIIHEALITAWPRLVGWQREDAESARMRDALRASARQWEERGRASGLLWRNEVLAEYRLWRARFPGGVTSVEQAFADASLRDERRAQRIRRSALVGVFALLAAGLVVLFQAWRDSEAQMVRLREEQARLALLNERPFAALAYLGAIESTASNPAREHLKATAQWQTPPAAGDWSVEPSMTRLASNERAQTFLAFDREHPASWFDLTTDRRLTLGEPAAAFVGDEVWATNNTTKVQVYTPDGGSHSVEAPVAIWSLQPAGANVGTMIAEAGETGAVFADGRWVAVPLGQPSPHTMCECSAQSTRCACFAGRMQSAQALLKGVVTFESGQFTTRERESVIKVATYVGDRLLVGTSDGKIWSPDDPSWKIDIGEQPLFPRSKSSTILAAVALNKVFFIDTTKGAFLPAKFESPQYVADAQWRNDHELIIATDDGRIRTFDLVRGQVVGAFWAHPSAISTIAPLGDGVLSVDSLGHVKRWPQLHRFAEELETGVLGLWEDPTSRTALTATERGWSQLSAHGQAAPLGPVSAGARVVGAPSGSVNVFASNRTLVIEASLSDQREVALPDDVERLSVSSDRRLAALFFTNTQVAWLRLDEGALNPIDAKVLGAPGIDGLFTSDGASLLITLETGEIAKYRLREGVVEKRIAAHQKAAWFLRLASSAEFATASYDGRLILWNESALVRIAECDDFVGAGKLLIKADWRAPLVSVVDQTGQWLVVNTSRNEVISSVKLPFEVTGAFQPERGERIQLSTDSHLRVETWLWPPAAKPRVEAMSLVDEKIVAAGAPR